MSESNLFESEAFAQIPGQLSIDQIGIQHCVGCGVVVADVMREPRCEVCYGEHKRAQLRAFMS